MERTYRVPRGFGTPPSKHRTPSFFLFFFFCFCRADIFCLLRRRPPEKTRSELGRLVEKRHLVSVAVQLPEITSAELPRRSSTTSRGITLLLRGGYLREGVRPLKKKGQSRPGPRPTSSSKLARVPPPPFHQSCSNFYLFLATKYD